MQRVLFAFAFAVPFLMNAQTTLVSEDFDGYAAGGLLTEVGAANGWRARTYIGWLHLHSSPASVALKTMARRCWNPITNMAPSQLLNVMSGVPKPIVDLRRVESEVKKV